jgi:hypothetical protein
MTSRRHVDDLFTGALDGDLSPIDDARFHAHLQTCTDCSAAFAEFSATVEALHELPKARMARVVHLPSTPPVAERASRPRIGLDWFNPGALLRRFPATAVAGAAAVVLVIVALAHGSGVTSPATAALSNPDVGSGAVAQGSTPESSCTTPTAVTKSSPPANFSTAEVVTNAGLPGVRLVLSASSLSVTPGQRVSVYAQVSVPVATAQAPGATKVPQATRSVLPCVSIGVGETDAVIPTGSAGGTVAGSGTAPVAVPGAAPTPVTVGSSAVPPAETAPVVSFEVPAGLAPGTELRVVASLPAGFDGPGTPALSATLTLTTR